MYNSITFSLSIPIVVWGLFSLYKLSNDLSAIVNNLCNLPFDHSRIKRLKSSFSGLLSNLILITLNVFTYLNVRKLEVGGGQKITIWFISTRKLQFCSLSKYFWSSWFKIQFSNEIADSILHQAPVHILKFVVSYWADANPL